LNNLDDQKIAENLADKLLLRNDLLFPIREDILSVLGDVCLNKNEDFDKCFQYYKKVLDLQTNYFISYDSMLKFYLFKNVETNDNIYLVKRNNFSEVDLQNALSYFDQSISIHPNRAYPYFLKSMVLQSLNDFSNASINLNKALDLIKDDNTL